jgi:methylenetetrahydrofolate--tRNA-(uracil-5-)-methyltransferase
MKGQVRGPRLSVIGGGLAGSEAAWQAAERGVDVRLIEMRPQRMTGAHRGADLAELVCSNSLGSILQDRAGGVLKRELERLDSLLMRCARAAAIPAGAALAVDREQFARSVSERILAHPRIEVVREESQDIPDGPAVIATGPLTSPAFSVSLRGLTGTDHLYFFDAVAPIVTADSIDRETVFSDARNSLSADYLNCPMNEVQYRTFVGELMRAECIPLKEFESSLARGVRAGSPRFFEGCVPVEVLARRGPDTLAYGTMRPVGLCDPRSGQKPCAVVQLRRENAPQTLYNLVGFQTNLREAEQRRVFRMIPGLEHAEFVRYGRMHRNTFLNAPRLLLPTLQFRGRPDLFFAGQLTGVEGYVGNIATGLLAGWNAARVLEGRKPVVPPEGTMLGALCRYITQTAEAHFQPMKANFGLLPPIRIKNRSRLERNRVYAASAIREFDGWFEQITKEN